MISNPVTIGPDATLEELDGLCGQYRVSGLPVVDADGAPASASSPTATCVSRRSGVGDDAASRRHDADAAHHRAGRHRREDATALLRQHKRERLPLVDDARPARRADHGQGLRQVRAVPPGHQGRRRPAPGRRGDRLLRRRVGARAPRSSRPGSTSSWSTPRTGTPGRCSTWSSGSRPTRPPSTSRSSAATSRPGPARRRSSTPAPTRSRSGSGRARSAPPASSPASASRRSRRSTRRRWRPAGRGPGHRRRRAAVLRRHRQGPRRGRRHGHARLAARRVRGEPRRPGLRQRQAVQVLPRHGVARRDELARARSRTRRTATSRPTSSATTGSSRRASRARCPTAARSPPSSTSSSAGLHQSMFYVGAQTVPRAAGNAAGSCGSRRRASRSRHPHDVQMTVEAPNYTGAEPAAGAAQRARRVGAVACTARSSVERARCGRRGGVPG